MRKIISIVVLFHTFIILAQKPCEYSSEVNDSIGTYKSTKDVLVYEQMFGANERYLFLSLQNVNGTPLLNLQWIRKSNQFIPAFCLSTSTKLHIQLENGKIISLIYSDNENCGNMIKDSNGKNTRILSGNFLFMKGTIEELQTHNISLIRISMSTESKDFIIRDALNSELLKATTKPSTFFKDYLKCVLE
uniref:hypothetical protein n=1 Tax=Flavobacterium sp. TaxID=239 RepID=UPI0040495A95